VWCDLGAACPPARRLACPQDAAVEAVAQAVLRTRAGLGRPSQPIGSFLYEPGVSILGSGPF
jgi:hypothetical protein